MKLVRGEFILAAERPSGLNSSCGSLMQGALMQKIDKTYGEILHRSERKPYSQYLICGAAETRWMLQTLTEEAESEIWTKTGAANWDSIYLEQKDLHLTVQGIKRTSLSEDELLKKTFFGDCPRRIKIRFITPASFKTAGDYQNYPTVRHIFQSLIQKFDAVSTDVTIGLEHVLEDIEQYTKVTGYNLRSVWYSVEGVKIPSFLGTMSFLLKGPQQLVNLTHMLLVFGTYAGVGIKTAMGMGGMQIAEGVNASERKHV